MTRGKDDGIDELLGTALAAEPDELVATTILDCGASEVAESVPVGLKLRGAEDVAEAPDCVVAAGAAEVAEVPVAVGVLVCPEVAAAADVELPAGDGVWVAEDPDAAAEVTEPVGEVTDAAVDGVTEPVLAVGARPVDPPVDVAGEVNEPWLELGAATPDVVGEVRTDCAEVTSDAMDDATEAAEDSSEVMEEMSDESAVWAID